jgi:hypothetical protein
VTTTSSQIQIATPHDVWPRLPLDAWKETYATVQLWTQIVGKTRLELSPPENHWWHVALYISVRGITTSPIPHADRTFEVDLDLIDHRLVVRTSDGRIQAFPLRPMTVADFYRRYLELLHALDIECTIWPVPCEIADVTPFTRDRIHKAYDADAVHRCWRTFVQVDRVTKRYRGQFLGKSSPVHLWWGAFDLACTRFSGRPAPVHPGGVPNLPDRVVREAYSHECMSVGWWPGGGTAANVEPPVLEPAFYAYAYPEPQGFATAAVRPAAAYYHPTLFEWVLPYEAVRAASDPDRILSEFYQDAYEAAANLGGWDRAALERQSMGDQAGGAR